MGKDWEQVDTLYTQMEPGYTHECIAYDKRYGVVPAVYSVYPKDRASWYMLEVSEDPTELFNVTHWMDFPEPPPDALVEKRAY